MYKIICPADLPFMQPKISIENRKSILYQNWIGII